MRAREPALLALFAAISGAYEWKNTPSRRLVLWDSVPPEQRPAFYQFEGGQEPYAWSQSPNPKRTLRVKLFIYFDSSNPDVPTAPQLSAVKDAIDLALAPSVLTGKCDLGGTCEFCRIYGEITNDPGDIDKDGLLIIPVEIVLP